MLIQISVTYIQYLGKYPRWRFEKKWNIISTTFFPPFFHVFPDIQMTIQQMAFLLPGDWTVREDERLYVNTEYWGLRD